MKKGFLQSVRGALGIAACAALLFLNYTGPMASLRNLSDDVHIRAGSSFTLPVSLGGLFTVSADDDSLAVTGTRDNTLAEVTGGASAHTTHVTLKLLGVIPVKEVSVYVRNDVMLVPGGTSIGVTLYTKGALVVGLSSVTLSNGQTVSPAAAAGIQAGDLLEKANGIEIKDADHLRTICNENSNSLELTILRNGERMNVAVHPVLDPADDKYRMGMWVRDSTAGVGTLSFFDPSSGWYAALGHAITDVDTRSNLTVREGEIVQSDIVEIVQGTQGEPGELRGTFGVKSLPLGTIETNSPFGIYGKMYQSYHNPLFPAGIPMAFPEDVQLGDCELLTTLDNTGVKPYKCRIIKLNPQSNPAPKGMVVQITDPELLARTGGIVQGMSGSPLVQNGKLIGVVTHVFINDPTKGYCMYAQWMEQQIVSR